MITVSDRLQATAKREENVFGLCACRTHFATDMYEHNQIYSLTYISTYVEHIYTHQNASLFKTATAANDNTHSTCKQITFWRIRQLLRRSAKKKRTCLYVGMYVRSNSPNVRLPMPLKSFHLWRRRCRR